jgi:hypothetical protein
MFLLRATNPAILPVLWRNPVHGVAAEVIELGDDQHIIELQPVHQLDQVRGLSIAELSDTVSETTSRS